MGFFGKFFQALLRFFGVRRSDTTAQDGADVSPSLTEVEVVDRDSVGSEEVVPLGEDGVSLPGVGAAVSGAGGGEGEPEEPLDATIAHEPRYLWCLDNGHGKATPGKRSGLFEDGTRLFEYELNRGLNQFLMEKLDDAGVQYFNIVPEVEGDISLATRVSRANNKATDLQGGKIYLSIHANANGSSGWDAQNVRGVETWFYGGSSRGKKIASAFQRAIIEDMGWKDRFLKFHEPYSRSFYVLRNTNMPAILVENGFFSSRDDAKLLRLDAHREQIANAYVKAILEIEKNGIDSIETYKKIYKYS